MQLLHVSVIVLLVPEIYNNYQYWNSNLSHNKGNNKITELRTILPRETDAIHDIHTCICILNANPIIFTQIIVQTLSNSTLKSVIKVIYGS